MWVALTEAQRDETNALYDAWTLRMIEAAGDDSDPEFQANAKAYLSARGIAS